MTRYPDHIEIAKTLLEKQTEINQLRAERDAMQDLLGSIWLYVGWRSATRSLTTEQRELWAKAVDAECRKVQIEASEEPHPVAVRWWRNDFAPATDTAS